MVAVLRKVMVGVWYRRKLHDTISQNGYGNAIIGRYGGYFEEGDGGFNAPAKVAWY